MKKIIALTILAGLFAGFIVHAQAVTDTNAPLTTAQVQQVNQFVDNMLPLIPNADIPLAGKIIGYLSVIALAGRLVKGWFATGTFTGGIWHAVAGLLFNHTPTPPDTSNAGTVTGQGAGAAKLRGISLLLCIAFPALMLTGCTLDHQQGKILSVTNRGLYIAVAATDSTTGTPKITLGLGSETVTILPTSDTNGVVTAPNFANSSIVDQTVNPFSTSGSESLAAGNYQVNQTNNASATQPILPK